MGEALVKAVDVVKQYGSFNAVNGVNFELAPGRIIGLLGPNGSGKTTIIKMLAGLLTVTGGTLTIDNLPVGYETKGLVSYLPERPYFNSWMKVSECLDYFADFYEDFDGDLALKMLADLGVDVHAKLKTLSKGTKEKVQLVLVMSRRAKLYLLDEPIAGVDPAAREYILKTIVRAYHPEATILISTHLIQDVEPILDEFMLIKEGVVLLRGDVKLVRDQYGISLDEYFREVFRCSANY